MTQSEFNLVGAPSEQLRRRLLYLAETGNDSVANAMRKSEEVSGNAGKRDADLARQVLSSAQAEAERATREFNNRLDELEQANIEALHENDLATRAAERALEEMLRSAKRITMPDGTVQMLLRDGDQVRFQDGSIVDPDVVSADQVSDNPDQWRDVSGQINTIDTLHAKREDLLNFGERIDAARDKAGGGRRAFAR